MSVNCHLSVTNKKTHSKLTSDVWHDIMLFYNQLFLRKKPTWCCCCVGTLTIETVSLVRNPPRSVLD